ncbi:hypothetical protein QZH41_006844 [Actinostola sp. cb2023]|nr:hypothetical protein QZH41_006844 [Actinostola sp. cb2023]
MHHLLGTFPAPTEPPSHPRRPKCFPFRDIRCYRLPIDEPWVEILNDAKDEFEVDGAIAVFSTWGVEAEDPFDIGDIEIVDGIRARAGRLALDARMADERAARLLVVLPEGEFLLRIKFLRERNEGAKAAQQMGLITINKENFESVTPQRDGSNVNQLLTVEGIVQSYPEEFESQLGSFPGKVHLEFDENVTPTITPTRRISTALKEKFKQELDRMEELGVVAKVEKPTPWRVDQVLDRLDGVLDITDDILVYGVGATNQEANEDHDRKLTSLLERCKEQGVALNKDKIKFRLREVTYMGHVFTDKGLKIDPEKVKAVQDMPRPTDVEAVHRLNGFVNYLAKFLPKLADSMEPIRRLGTQRRRLGVG